MKFRSRWCAWTLLGSGLFMAGAPALCAQQRDHAVSQQELRQDLQNAAEARAANEAAVRQLLSTDAAQKIMKSSNIQYTKVDQAVSQLNDQDLARMAQRSREIQKDFAAGTLTNRDLIILLLIFAGLILIIVAVR
jgi:preprotein translocase subunit SecF